MKKIKGIIKNIENIICKKWNKINLNKNNR